VSFTSKVGHGTVEAFRLLNRVLQRISKIRGHG
jgi:hypothetical protein